MTAKAPGRKPVNRGMRRMGHGFFARMIHYKADAAVEVDPAHTSRRCHDCGHTEQANRPTRAVFKCRECGHRDHADLNAALNIRASGIGAARRGAGESKRPSTFDPQRRASEKRAETPASFYA